MSNPDATPAAPEIAAVVRSNISALIETRQKFLAAKSTQQRAADRITSFTGSMLFVYVHAAFYGLWLLVNARVLPIVAPFDPFPFVMLAMLASVEAIFLSTFVLISQNRMSELAAQTADLHLQVSLLAEHEITRLIRMVDSIANKVGAPIDEDPKHLSELKQDVKPVDVINELARTRSMNNV